MDEQTVPPAVDVGSGSPGELGKAAVAPSTAVSEAVSKRQWIAGAVVLMIAFAWPFVFPNNFIVAMGTMVLLNAIGSSSLHLIIRTGHVSLGHAAFMGIGAYTAVLCVMNLGIPFPLNVLLGATASALVALVIGPLLLRLTGKYFVLVTFMLGEIIRLVFLEWSSLTGGANGIFDIPLPLSSINTPRRFYLLTLLFAVLCVGLVVRILVSEVGREIDSVRESERVAACAGVPVVRLKVIIFTIACGLVGIQGGLHAYFLKYIDPGSFTVVISLNFVVMNVIGGMEHLAGALIGTVFLVVLPELLRGYVELQHVFFGIILMIVMAAMPGGMVELVSQLRARRQRRLEKEEGL